MPATKAVRLAVIVASLCLAACLKKPHPTLPPPPSPAMRGCPDGTTVPSGEQCPSRPINASILADAAGLAVCSGQQVHFTASPTLDGAIYHWTINGAPAVAGPSLSIPTGGHSPGTYAVGLTITAPGFTDSATSTSFTIRPYVPPVATLTAEPAEILAGEKSTLRLQATSGQCGGEIREVRYTASEGSVSGSISGATFDSSSMQFAPSPGQTKQVIITAQLQDARSTTTTSIAIVVASRAASLQVQRLPDVVFPANRSDVNNCGMRVLLEELAPYMDRDPAGKVLLMGLADASEGRGLDQLRASNAARVLTCAGRGPCANLDSSRVYVQGGGTDQGVSDFSPAFCSASVKERAGQAVNPDDPRAKYRRVAVWFIPGGAPMPSFAANAPTAGSLRLTRPPDRGGLPVGGAEPPPPPPPGGSGPPASAGSAVPPVHPPVDGAPAGFSVQISWWLVPLLLIALSLMLYGARAALILLRKPEPAGLPERSEPAVATPAPDPEPGGPNLRSVGRDDEGYYIRGVVSAVHHFADQARVGSLLEVLAHERYNFHRIPQGYPEGSPRWQDHFREVLEQCEAVLVVLTAESLGKRWLNWQISQVTEAQQKRDVPIYVAGLDQQVFDVARTVSLLSDLGPTLSPLIGMTWYRSSPQDQEELTRLLKGSGAAATRGLRCFISYSRKRKESADRLRADLLRVPVGVWKDLEDTPAGTQFRQQIDEALQSSTHVLFLLNRESSHSGFVIDEVDRAQRANKVIIPLMEEEKIELPLGFGGTQAIDFTDYDAGFRKLLQSLAATRKATAAQLEPRP